MCHLHMWQNTEIQNWVKLTLDHQINFMDYKWIYSILKANKVSKQQAKKETFIYFSFSDSSPTVWFFTPCYGIIKLSLQVLHNILKPMMMVMILKHWYFYNHYIVVISFICDIIYHWYRKRNEYKIETLLHSVDGHQSPGKPKGSSSW